ncbi:MAG TPA: hypothetical protein VGS27_26245 [Candidatus Sulfotelmatobacter sp.]|nr:hypothetical protein [Candidatus Sulfotelmatobacter sp.]
MKDTLTIFFAVLLLSVSFSRAAGQASAPTSQVPEVYLVGTAHDGHFWPEAHYSINDLRKEIETIRPQVVCGEIAPEAYKTPMEGYYPPEAVYLDEIAPVLNARFVAADWRIASAWQGRAQELMPKEVRAQWEASEAEIGKQLKEALKTQTVFDFLHADFVVLSKRKFEDLLGENTDADIALGGWHERNRRIVENCLDASHGAQRVVIAFGASHIEQLQLQLERVGITAKIPPRYFTPAGMGTVPGSVITRWRANRDNLKGILAGTIKVSNDALSKVKDSNRVQELDRAIAAYDSEAAKR